MIRADVLLQQCGLARSRAQAQAMIAAGEVFLADGTYVGKASRKLPTDSHFRISGGGLRFVARSGEKLAAALDAFSIEVQGNTVLDIGASTGGFTDCVLQRGAASVVCVDVGHGQLAPEIAAEARVTSFEGVNARSLDNEELEPPVFDRIVIDVSFISLRLILGPAWNRLRSGGYLIALVKPQFEVGKTVMDATGGVLRDTALQADARDRVLAFADGLPGAVSLGWIDSPISGGDGNHEFLAAWTKAAKTP
ncbi:MAG: TlyA family RNA methyltransferase [Opitutales bacterium]